MADFIQNVKVILTADNKTEKGFKEAQKATSDLRNQVGSLAKVMGVGLLAAGAGATAFLISSAKSANEAQASLARVDSILKTMGDSALKNRDAILKQADAAVKLGFDDEAAAESITKFYQKTEDLSTAMRANGLAMDYARFKNISLEEASMKMNLALSGSTKVLNELGLEIREGASQIEILDALQTKLGGTAENVKNTFENQMKVMSISMENLKETIGTALLEAITPLIQSLAAWAADPAVQEKIKNIAKLMGDWAKVVIPILVEAVKIMIGWFKTFWDILITVEMGIFRVIDAIAAVIEKAREMADILGKTLKGGVGGIASGAFNQLKFMVSGKAAGGPVSMGTPYMVGERGPELFVPNSSGTIIPNGAGGTVVNIYNPVMLDDTYINKIGEQITRILGRDLRY